MIQINLFTSGGSHYSERSIVTKSAVYEFLNIKKENKLKVKLVIYCNAEMYSVWTDFITKHSDGGIDVFLVNMPNDEYIGKVNIALQTDCEYSCKWDDDCFINRHVWDYMIDNVHILDSNQYSVICPTFSNGIPSCDFFLNDIASESVRNLSHSIFLKDNVFPSIWGFDYTQVVNNIASMTEWDYKNHWNFVSNSYSNKYIGNNMSYPMGIHPARFSYDYNILVADYACSNPNLVLDKHNFYLETQFDTPYFCNNIFITKTEFYKKSQTLYFDHWDEGQLNDLGKLLGLKPIFVRNCFGIHMAYGCTGNQKEIEQHYIKNFYEKNFIL
jgi:hypothetical protein